MPAITIRTLVFILLLAFISAGSAQSVSIRLQLAFGVSPTLDADGIYHVTPTRALNRDGLPNRLQSALSHESIPAGTTVRVNNTEGIGVLQGAKAHTGSILLSWIIDPETHTPSPSTPPPPNRSTGSTWGSECTSYQTGNTTGVRCRDSSGNTWGSECTSYQSGNTTGVRCREW